MSGLGVIVLAAGMGTRMKSRTHKVLHPVCGVPMGQHVIDAALALKPAKLAHHRQPPEHTGRVTASHRTRMDRERQVVGQRVVVRGDGDD